MDNQTTTTSPAMKLNGSYRVYRSPDSGVSIPYKCGTGTAPWTSPCVTYSGSQTVKVTRLPADLSLTSSHPTVQPNTAVTFKAKPSVATIGTPAFVTPFTVKTWRFVEDSARTYVPCASTTDTTCVLSVRRGGTMHVTAEVNGREITKTIRVRPELCLFPDTLTNPVAALLNRQAVRDDLDEMFHASLPFGPPANRIERLSFGYDSSNALVTRRPTYSGANACRSPSTFPSPEPGTRLYMAHTHPFRPGPAGADSVPDYCDSERGFTNFMFPGPSLSDWDRAREWGTVSFVVDKDSIYGMLPPVGSDFEWDDSRSSLSRISAASAASLKRSYPRRSASCSILP